MNDSAVILIEVKNTFYWDGYYCLGNFGWGWQYQSDYCFAIKAVTVDPLIIELHGCSGVAARFRVLRVDEDTKPEFLSEDFREDLQDAVLVFRGIHDA